MYVLGFFFPLAHLVILFMDNDGLTTNHIHRLKTSTRLNQIKLVKPNIKEWLQLECS